jgi:hypothetical protein
MSAINHVLFPVLLFAVYFFLAIQFLPQSSNITISDYSKVIEQQENSAEQIHQESGYFGYAQDESVNANSDIVISRDWLETQSLANLKSIAAELYITPVGDKRSKLTWIDAIAVSTPENTILAAVNLCSAL